MAANSTEKLICLSQVLLSQELSAAVFCFYFLCVHRYHLLPLIGLTLTAPFSCPFTPSNMNTQWYTHTFISLNEEAGNLHYICFKGV